MTKSQKKFFFSLSSFDRVCWMMCCIVFCCSPYICHSKQRCLPLWINQFEHNILSGRSLTLFRFTYFHYLLKAIFKFPTTTNMLPTWSQRICTKDDETIDDTFNSFFKNCQYNIVRRYRSRHSRNFPKFSLNRRCNRNDSRSLCFLSNNLLLCFINKKLHT